MARFDPTSLLLPAVIVVAGVAAAAYALAYQPTVDQTIVFTAEGFEQPRYEIRTGQRIEVVNRSNNELSFTGGSHPNHHEHSELHLEDLGPGESAQLDIDKAGTFDFHDHESGKASVLVVRQ